MDGEAESGLTFEEAQSQIEIETIEGVPIPFASAELMLRMKEGTREKDAADRTFLQELLRSRRRDSD